jgi:hypothetical protein
LSQFADKYWKERIVTPREVRFKENVATDEQSVIAETLKESNALGMILRILRQWRLVAEKTDQRRGFCARAPSGKAAAAPPTSVMNTRRLMCCPQHCSLPHRDTKQRTLQHSKLGGPPSIAKLGFEFNVRRCCCK